jgi:glycosyltransferase involved in cell wall biosynthesis
MTDATSRVVDSITIASARLACLKEIHRLNERESSEIARIRAYTCLASLQDKANPNKIAEICKHKLSSFHGNHELFKGTSNYSGDNPCIAAFYDLGDPSSLTPYILKKYAFHDPSSSQAPLISVVMTAYNSQETIADSALSLLVQSYQNIEVIIVDDHSSDSTREIIVQLAKNDARVKYLFSPSNIGTYGAKNLGIASCTGKYVTFNDSDDISHPHRLSIQYEEFCRTSCVANRVNYLRYDGLTGQPIIINKQLSKIALISLFLERKTFYDVGFFDSSVRRGADDEFCSRLQTVYGKDCIYSISSILYYAQLTEGSLVQDMLTKETNGALKQVRSKERRQYSSQYVKEHSNNKNPEYFLEKYSPSKHEELLFQLSQNNKPSGLSSENDAVVYCSKAHISGKGLGLEYRYLAGHAKEAKYFLDIGSFASDKKDVVVYEITDPEVFETGLESLMEDKRNTPIALRDLNHRYRRIVFVCIESLTKALIDYAGESSNRSLVYIPNLEWIASNYSLKTMKEFPKHEVNILTVLSRLDKQNIKVITRSSGFMERMDKIGVSNFQVPWNIYPTTDSRKLLPLSCEDIKTSHIPCFLADIGNGGFRNRKGGDIVAATLNQLAQKLESPIKIIIKVFGNETTKLFQSLSSSIQSNLIHMLIIDEFIPESDLEKLYVESDVFLYPSRFDGHGLSLVRAINNGLLVIHTDGEPWNSITRGYQRLLIKSKFHTYLDAAPKYEPCELDLARKIKKVVTTLTPAVLKHFREQKATKTASPATISMISDIIHG